MLKIFLLEKRLVNSYKINYILILYEGNQGIAGIKETVGQQ